MKKYIAYSFMTFTMLFSQAQAAPKVSSPQTNAGVAETEIAGEVGKNGSRVFNNTSIKFKYGFDDRWKGEVAADIVYLEGEGWDYDATGIKLKYELTEEGPYFFGSALEVGYEFGANGNGDKIEFGAILEKNIDDVEILANFDLDQGVDDNNDNQTGFDIALGAYRPYMDHLNIGLEYYGDFGDINNTGSFDDQGHQLGPMIEYKVGGAPIKFELGLLAGLSDSAPDASLRYLFKYEF